MRRRISILLVFVVIAIGFFDLPKKEMVLAASDPSLLISPPTGTFAVDSTFDFNIAINTQGRNINAFKAKLYFPPDRLQVVSSNTGKSITGFWVRSPAYSNERGEIDLEGAIPSPGINTSFGVIATITFRVKSLGIAAVRFDNESAMYLNDGNGTQVNASFQNALYHLVLPPPNGPIVVSSTHPDQTKWYKANDVILQWNNPSPVEGYSYLVNSSPVDLPDNVSEGVETDTIYKSLSDGIYYFHIKGLRNGVWGGVTHYGIKIQTGSPAGFAIDVNPGLSTSSKTIVFNFSTTDTLSGLSHYEAKIIRRDISGVEDNRNLEPFFFEAHSPHILTADDYGKYDFIVRAYNNAGSFTESTVQVKIVKPVFQLIAGEGLKVGDLFIIPWYLLWVILVIALIILGYISIHMYKWHLRLEMAHLQGRERNDVNQTTLLELKDRFKKLSIIVSIVFVASAVLGNVHMSYAAQVSPPVVNLVSENITNDEIFYIGGRAAAGSGSSVIVYLESLSTGETFSFSVPVSPTGDWLYTHNSFMEAGNYLLWTQLKIGDQSSPPSGQVQLTVSPKALQLGASRISYETLYLLLFIGFFLVASALGSIIFHYWRKVKHKRDSLLREVHEAEDAIIRGFAILRKDIESEVRIIQQAKMNRQVSLEEQSREKQLLADLEQINRHIEKEVWDIEKALG